MVSLLHKELEDKVHESGEAHEQEGWRLEVGGYAAEERNEIRTSKR